MTRWIQEFNQNPFKTLWTTLFNETEQLDVDDQTVTTTVEELARLKKVLAFVNNIITNIDLELTPKSVWANCQGQAEACLQQVRSYATVRNFGYLVQANEHADNLLTYVRPYMVIPEQNLKAYGKAIRAFSGQISDYIEAFHEQASKVQSDLTASLDDATTKQREIEAIELRVKQFDQYLFEGIDGNRAAQDYITSMVSEIEGIHESVDALHKKLLDGPDSTSETIQAYANSAQQLCDSLNEMLDSATSRNKELATFYERIFGRPMADADELKEGGLKLELDARLEQLNKFESTQKTRQKALFESIESLLPGATSAGLASSYKTLKDHFAEPITTYTRAFYASMAALLLGGVILVSDSITLWPFQIQLVKAANWEEMLRDILTRVPIILPIVWFALFSATRRSQYERLQQEYAHKEAFASSYESYKKQLSDLNIDADALQKELIAKAIDAISFNASKTLDGKHAEKLPISQLVEKLNADELKKLIDLVKGK